MELAFTQKDLRDLCESERTAQRVLGAEVAASLKRRLADLHAASCVSDLVAGRPHERSGSGGQQMELSLQDGYAMIFSSNHEANALREDGGVDWSKVERIKIISIEKPQ